VILLDTHALLWLVEGHPQLGDRARHVADEALTHDDLGVWGIRAIHAKIHDFISIKNQEFSVRLSPIPQKTQ
jgi:hypothetical protein